MTAIANPDLSDIDVITMKRIRFMSSVSVAIFALIGLGFFIILRGDEKISNQAQHRQNAILGASGIALLAGGIVLLVLTFWHYSRSLDRLRDVVVG
jgi:Co/Zn/Cd efflux system component